MRVFIGIKINGDAVKQIEKFLKPLKKISTPVKWVKYENIHLTLMFIGELDPKKLEILKGLLMDISVEHFKLTLRGIGTFGRGKLLSIVWIGIEPDLKLDLLFNSVKSKLEFLGIDIDKREFKPHLTVGRNKKKFNYKKFIRQIALKSEQYITELQITGFYLIKSKLTPEGPVYTVLKEYPLD